MQNHGENRIHYRLKTAKSTTKHTSAAPYALCALGASAVTAAVIAICHGTKRKYICIHKKHIPLL